jgi:hypothetical protein
VLATGLGNLPVVRDRTANTVQFEFHHGPKSRPSALWRAIPGLVPVNPRVLPGLAKPLGLNLTFWLSGISIYGSIQISYCKILTLVYCCPFLMYWPSL